MCCCHSPWQKRKRKKTASSLELPISDCPDRDPSLGWNFQDWRHAHQRPWISIVRFHSRTSVRVCLSTAVLEPTLLPHTFINMVKWPFFFFFLNAVSWYSWFSSNMGLQRHGPTHRRILAVWHCKCIFPSYDFLRTFLPSSLLYCKKTVCNSHNAQIRCNCLCTLWVTHR